MYSLLECAHPLRIRHIARERPRPCARQRPRPVRPVPAARIPGQQRRRRPNCPSSYRTSYKNGISAAVRKFDEGQWQRLGTGVDVSAVPGDGGRASGHRPQWLVLPYPRQGANSENECVDQLLEFLFTVDNPVENLFALTVQLFQRTWREMQATSDEAEKVSLPSSCF